MNKVLVFILISIIICSTMVSAATLIESRSDRHTMKMWIEGAKSRIETPEQDGYMLMDLKQNKMYVISTKERVIMDMSGQLDSQTEKPESADINMQLTKKGDGPNIAGYSTEHYTLSANGKHCADEYLSLEVLKDPGLKEYARHATGMPKSSTSFGMLDTCTLASILVAKRFNEIGFPLRTIQANGDRFEVTRIQSKAPLSADAFDIPKDYQIVDMSQIRSRVMSGGLEQILQQRGHDVQENEETGDPQGEKDVRSPMDAIGNAVGKGLEGFKGLFGN